MHSRYSEWYAMRFSHNIGTTFCSVACSTETLRLNPALKVKLRGCSKILCLRRNKQALQSQDQEEIKKIFCLGERYMHL